MDKQKNFNGDIRNEEETRIYCDRADDSCCDRDDFFSGSSASGHREFWWAMLQRSYLSLLRRSLL